MCQGHVPRCGQHTCCSWVDLFEAFWWYSCTCAGHTPSTTLVELFQSELALTQETAEGEWLDDSTGQPLDFNATVASECIRAAQPSASVPRDSQVIEPTLLAQIQLDFGDVEIVDATVPGLVGSPAVSVGPVPVKGSPEVLFQLPPRTSSDDGRLVWTSISHWHSTCQHLATPGPGCRGPGQWRLCHGRWRAQLHLRACLNLSGRSDVQYLDPLLALSWLKNGSVDCVQEWTRQFPELQCIVNVVHVWDHWMPVLWTLGLCEVQVFMWEHSEVEIDCLSPLLGLISTAFSKPLFLLACSVDPFPGATVEQQLLHPSPTSFSEEICHPLRWIDCLAQWLERQLCSHLQNFYTTQAVVLGTGSNPMSLVSQVNLKTWCSSSLISVACQVDCPSVGQVRSPASCSWCVAMEVPESIGQFADSAFATCSAWWTSPAKQHQSSLQTKKTDGKKNLPSRPAELDPTKLTIEHGAFCVGNDEPVGQVPFSQIGPLAVLSTMAEELPVLHAGKAVDQSWTCIAGAQSARWIFKLLWIGPPFVLPRVATWTKNHACLRCFGAAWQSSCVSIRAPASTPVCCPEGRRW